MGKLTLREVTKLTHHIATKMIELACNLRHSNTRVHTLDPMLHSTSCIIQIAMLSPIVLSSQILWCLSGMPLFPLPSFHVPNWLRPRVPLVNLRIIAPEKPSLTSLTPTLHNECPLLFPGLTQHCVLTSITISEQKSFSKSFCFGLPPPHTQGFPGHSHSKEAACSAGGPGWEDPLEKWIATHSSVLAWRIPYRGALGSTVHGFVKSQAQLSD